jgi:hypothetical protein
MSRTWVATAHLLRLIAFSPPAHSLKASKPQSLTASTARPLPVPGRHERDADPGHDQRRRHRQP